MRVVVYTSGTTGAGRFVVCCSAALGLRRAGINDVTIVSSHEFAFLADALGIAMRAVPFEGPAALATDQYPESVLSQTLRELKPDVVLCAQSWYALQRMTETLNCPIAIGFWNSSPAFFRTSTPDGEMAFDPYAFSKVLSWENFDLSFESRMVEPLLLRNPDEILPREEAASRLGIDPNRETAFIALNGRPGEFENLKKTYSYLEDEYQVVYSSNYHGGIFPAVDYYNAFDFIVCGAGYSQFWEAIYFQKEALFVPQLRRFESQAWRVDNCQDYRFTENGADQLARIIADL